MIILKISNLSEITEKILTQKLIDLLIKKEVELFNNVWVYVEDTIDFSLSAENDKIIINLQNAKPRLRVGLKYVINYRFTLTKIEIYSKKVLIYDGDSVIMLEE